jgi:hypothetical protein
MRAIVPKLAKIWLIPGAPYVAAKYANMEAALGATVEPGVPKDNAAVRRNTQDCVNWGHGARRGDHSNGTQLVDQVLGQKLGANVASNCQANQALGLLIHLAPGLLISAFIVSRRIRVGQVLGLQGLVERVGELVE